VTQKLEIQTEPLLDKRGNGHGTAAQALGVALSLLMTIAPARTVHSGETLEELQRRFDNESDGVNKPNASEARRRAVSP